MSKILVIGGGITGGVTAGLLHKERNDIEVIIWEQAAEIGGRMSTTPNPNNTECTTDLGPQFVIATLEYIRNHAQFYDELLEDQTLVSCMGEIDGMKLPSSSMAFVAPSGIGSLTRHFFSKAGAEVHLKQKAESISIDSLTQKWIVESSNGVSDIFDIIILTIPVPEILQIKGEIQNIIENQKDVKNVLQKITYTSRYSLGIYYNDSVKYLEKLPWCAKLFKGDDMIQFISIDNRKRENPTALPALAVQTTIPFSWAHIDDDKRNIQDVILERVMKLLPGLPTPDNTLLKCWTYARVECPHPDYIGCLIIHKNPLLIAGGDGFTQSSFNGCLDSAMKIVEQVLKCLKC